jgi:ABC-type uncharacterized transport system auxiliary subunit
MKLFSILLCVIMLTGCATLFDNSPDVISLQTSDGKPAAAKVDAGKGEILVTLPTTVPIARSSKPIVINVQETKTTKSSTYEATSHVTGLFWLDFIPLSPLSTTIDAATGNMWSYDDLVVVPVERKK